jgi:hypothetical protein
MPRYISVKYPSKYNPGEFAGREYTYIDGIGLAVGDLVIAPAGKGQSLAMVTTVDVPESKIDERVMPLLKTITERHIEKEDETGEDIINEPQKLPRSPFIDGPF